MIDQREMVVPSLGVSVCVFMYTQLPNNYEKHRKHNDKTLSFVATSIIAGVSEINPRFFRNISKWVWFEVNCVFGFMFIINGPLTSIRPSIVSIFRSYILNLYTYPLLCFKIIFSSVDLIMYAIYNITNTTFKSIQTFLIYEVSPKKYL